ncbi:MAG: AAA family ATPase [Armatimonadetes bacterium]|nr:AAA family ATPase [Armatimonadota bacterium]
MSSREPGGGSLDHRGEILILTGTPGAGKTTTAEALARLPGSPKVHLHSDFYWGFIKNGHVAPWLPEADAQNRVIMQAVAASALAYAKGGYFVALDGIIGPWYLDYYRDLGVPLHYIVLRPDLDVAISRVKARSSGHSLNESGPVIQLHRQFSNLGDLEPNVVSTQGLTQEAQLETVTQALQSSLYRLKDTLRIPPPAPGGGG